MKRSSNGSGLAVTKWSSKATPTSLVKLAVAVTVLGVGLFYLLGPGITHSAGGPTIIVGTMGNTLTRFNSARPGTMLSSLTDGAIIAAQSTMVVPFRDDGSLPSANAFAVDLSNNLLRFNTATPGTIVSTTPITGLVAGDSVLAIDFRPVTEQLYALGSGSRLYIIDQATGVASQVGSSGAFILNGTEFGFDVNPVPDRIRVTSDADQNLRLDPNTGTLAATDPVLNYAVGDPNFGANPNVGGSAYTNSFAGSTTTTFYDIDTNLDILVIQNPPNNGTLNTVGPLGVNASSVIGFDIRGETNEAFATLVVGGVPGLYSINLTTGAATLIGNIGGGTTARGLAIAPQGFGNATSLIGNTVTFNGSSGNDTITFDQSGGLLRHNRFSAGDPGFNSNFDFDTIAPGDQTLSASNPAVNVIVNGGLGDERVFIGSSSSPAGLLAPTFSINGEGGSDTLTINDVADTTPRTVNIGSSTITGIGGNVSYATVENIFVNAGLGPDTINVDNTSAATSINAGGGDDSVAFSNGATLSGGMLDGGAGIDTLNYSAYTTDIAVNLGLGTTGLTATLGANQEVPPTTSSATGTATVSNYDSIAKTFDITVTVDGITPAEVTGFHIHRAPFGINGPIFIDFVPGGVPIAPIVPTPTGFTFTATGLALPVTQEAAFLGGVTYVNVHTGAFPGGAIRGQLFSSGNVNLASGTATGTAGVTNVENATGGTGGDSLVGSFSSNALLGNAGNDTLLAAPGNDTMNGGANDDVSVWSNGDGSDLIDGGTGTDIVQVNGSLAAGDQFLTQPNPADLTRVRFDRTNLGLFNLNIGTTETLIQNTVGGDDTLTVESLTGVPDLTTVNLNGQDGNDTFNVKAASTVTINVNGGLPTTLTGDTLNYNAEGRSFSGDTTPPDGQIVSPGVQNVNFQQLESVNVINAAADLSVIKSDAPDPVAASTNLTYTLIVSNNGPGDAQSLVLTDVVPASTTFVSFSAPAGWTATTPPVGGSGTITATNAALVNAATATFTLVVNVNSATPNGSTISNTASVSSGSSDPNLANNTSTQTTAVSLPGTLQFSAATYTVSEGAGAATITVNRTAGTAGTVTVNFATSDGTATAGSDYGANSGTLTFAPGVSNQTFTVPIIDDNASEGTEIVNLTLSGPTGAALLGTQSTAVLLIADNEPPPANSVNVFAVTVTNNLLSFNSAAPDTILNTLPLSGLQAGEIMLAIDFRPATGQLFGLGSSNRIYTINTTTGAATAVAGPFTPALVGSDFGADFNPTVDRLRVVSDQDQNLRLNPATGAVAATDTNLSYASGDANFGANPNVVGSAYTNSFAGSTSTSLYGIDSNLDTLVLQGSLNGAPVSPNSGQLTTVGALGVNSNGLVGFDIQGSNNRAFASLTAAGDSSSKLYTLNLTSGAATLIGTIGGPDLIRDVAVAAGTIQFSASTATVAENGGHVTLTVTRTGNTAIPAAVNFATNDGTATQKGDFTISLGMQQFAAGETSKTIDILVIDDVYVEGSENFTVTLSAATSDFALSGASTVTVTITDNDSVAPTTNPIDDAQFFVRLHYLDFLNREPEPGGLAFWTSQITGCGTDATCINRRRVEVSAAFFGSPEFQETGFLVFRLYKAGLNRQPTYLEFMNDRSQLPAGPNLENARVAFVNSFVQRAEFTTLFPATLTPAQYVDGLNANTGNSLTPAQRDALVTGLTNATETRATVLRKVADNALFAQQQTNPAFVLMEYFGYLRRDPDPGGQAFWLTILNSSGNFRGMVCAFLTSAEYQARFSPTRSRTDSLCAGL